MNLNGGNIIFTQNLIMHNSFILISNINTRSFRFISPSVLNISLSCPGLSYHYHPSKTRSWNLNPASYAICQGSWMMKGQRERYTIGGEEKAIIVWQQEGGKQEEKKVRSLFCFWWGSWVSSVNPLNTHTLMSPESQDITARTLESDLGKK